MKKITWVLLSLLIIQPLVIFLARGHLLAAVPVHYGLFGDTWTGLNGENLMIALYESAIAPLLLLASRCMPSSIFINPTRSWILTPKVIWLWWLFGINWLILLSLFSAASWISWGWQLLTLLGVIELIAYIVNVSRQQRHSQG